MDGSDPTTRRWRDPAVTADGSPRAHVAFRGYETLWVNTGSLCNIACANCYIESSPQNDRLAFLTASDFTPYLDELDALETGRDGPVCEIGFTGGEPFVNPHMIALIEAALARGRRVLILSNAMRPMRRPAMENGLIRLHGEYGEALAVRVSLDHHTKALHDEERGEGAFDASVDGLAWLARLGVPVSVAGRIAFAESEGEARAGFAALFEAHGVPIDVNDPSALVLFPEMDVNKAAPEISNACWDIVGADPNAMMCASSRMLIKRSGADHPVLAACTLLPYDPQFERGQTLSDAMGDTPLNHPFCAQFCVLGGASCTGGG